MKKPVYVVTYEGTLVNCFSKDSYGKQWIREEYSDFEVRSGLVKLKRVRVTK